VVIRSLRCLDTLGLDYPLTQHHIPPPKKKHGGGSDTDIMARITIAAANLCIKNKIYGLLNIMPSPDQDSLCCVRTRLLITIQWLARELMYGQTAQVQGSKIHAV